MIKWPHEPPGNEDDFKPLGPALPKEPKPTGPRYEKTDTPGVILDTVTGKMETNLPEPPSHFPSIPPIPCNEETLEALIAEYRKAHPTLFELWADYPLPSVCNSIPSSTKTNSISESFPERDSLIQRQSGKSLIGEMFSRYGLKTECSQSFQEPQSLPQPERIFWTNLPMYVRQEFLMKGLRRIIHGNYTYSCNRDDEWTRTSTDFLNPINSPNGV